MIDTEFFDKVIYILERDGWCQGQYTNYRGEHCLAGAMGRAAGLSLFYEEEKVLSGLIKKDNPLDNIVCWNDRLGRTKEQVIELLERAKELV